MDKQGWLKDCKEALIKGESIFINDSLSLNKEELNYQFFIRSSEDRNLSLSINELLDLTIKEFIEPYFKMFIAYYNSQLKIDTAISDYEFSKIAV